MTDSTPPMTTARLEALIAAFGADPRRWPEVERAAAEALLSQRTGGRDALADAAAFDEMLDTVAPPRASRRLRTVLERAGGSPRLRGVVVAGFGGASGQLLWSATVAGAACVVLGFLIGWLVLPSVFEVDVVAVDLVGDAGAQVFVSDLLSAGALVEDDPWPSSGLVNLALH